MARRSNAPPVVPTLKTSGVIAAQLGVPLHRVLYVLRTRGHIRPSARAGALRLYDRAAVTLVREELARIESRRLGHRTEVERE